jgi:hypothetical protein
VFLHARELRGWREESIVDDVRAGCKVIQPWFVGVRVNNEDNEKAVFKQYSNLTFNIQNT